MIDFKVSVRCMTYNQASYIVEALNGFCMQQTSFPYVCCILDDASTDGEQDVIRKYLEDYFDLNDNSVVKNEDTDDYFLTFAQHKSNRNCYFAVFYLKYNHYKIWNRKYQYISQWEYVAKYIAMCEGDDYWTDSQKLQKQYVFMEAHPECSLCFHPNYRLYTNGKRIDHYPRIKKNVYGTKDLIILGGPLMATSSLFFRIFDIVGNLPKFWANAPVGDVPLRLYLSTKGMVGYIDEIMTVYRKESYGSWSRKNRSIRVWVDFIGKMNKLYEDFDEYTNKRYHYAIVVKKGLNYMICLKGIFSAYKKKLFKSM